MKKLRRVCILLLFIIVLLIYGETYADEYNDEILNQLTQGKNVNVKATYYTDLERLFCVEYGQNLDGRVTEDKNYEAVPYFLEIDGDKSKLYALSSDNEGWIYNPEDAVAVGIERKLC